MNREELRQAMKSAGLTQEELAKMAGLSGRAIALYLHGKTQKMQTLSMRAIKSALKRAQKQQPKEIAA